MKNSRSLKLKNTVGLILVAALLVLCPSSARALALTITGGKTESSSTNYQGGIWSGGSYTLNSGVNVTPPHSRACCRMQMSDIILNYPKPVHAGQDSPCRNSTRLFQSDKGSRRGESGLGPTPPKFEFIFYYFKVVILTKCQHPFRY